jgi:hypothetical protein
MSGNLTALPDTGLKSGPLRQGVPDQKIVGRSIPISSRASRR